MATLDSGSGGGSGGITPHNPDVDTDTRVYVNDIRIPVADVDLYARKEGPTDLSRYVEGEFASPFHGEDYTSAFDGLTPSEQNDFDTLTIEVKDHITGNYHLAFRGLVTGVGNAPDSGEKIWHFRAQDPNLLIDKVPASARFKNATAYDALKYVRDRLNEKLPFEVSLEVTDEMDVQAPTFGDEVAFGVPIVGALSKFTKLMSTPKTFQANKHTLADVINWVSEKTGATIWLNPTEDGVGFVATDEPTARSHRAHYLDSSISNPTLRNDLSGKNEIAVEKNDALIELRPVNTIVLKGDAKKSLASVGPFELNSPQDEFTSVKARHKPLYKRAGERELHAEPDSLSDAATTGEMQNEAKKRLKKKIDETTGGDMQTLLTAPIKPYDRIEALPTCDEHVATNMEPITYEVSRVHHEIKASGISQTTLNIGVHAALSDIEIVKTWSKDT